MKVIIKNKSNQSKSILYKTVNAIPDTKNDHLNFDDTVDLYQAVLREGINPSNIYVKVLTLVGWRTLKQYDDHLENSLDEYFTNRVVLDPKKFTNNFSAISIGVYR